jgi:carboxyl-terminal processing protease
MYINQNNTGWSAMALQRATINILFAFLLIGGLSACKDEEDEPSPITNEENQYVNDWIEENMEYWYLWNDELPASTDKNQAPPEYFASLLHEDDRFSWIQENYEELLNSLQGINKEAGYEYVLYRESEGSDNVVAQVLYVKPNSPADAAGLKRGDLITKINNQTMTTSNYQDLIQDLKNNHSLIYKPLDAAAQSFGTEKTASLTTVQYVENPNYLKKTITIGNKKIGYYVYNFFASGTDGNEEQYDLEMDNIFNSFKDEGITDLVLDLRFNSGGSEVAAKNLASLVGLGIDGSKVFFKREYNEGVKNEILTNPQLGSAFLTSFYSAKSANIGSLLSNGRVYILTSSRTASASELIINSLKPYMEVFLIGDVTYGKNVGSISIYEENDPKNTWGLQPIVVKVANSAGFSDYGDGFTPDILNEDNSLYIYPLGDERENLLSLALAEITGTAPLGRVAAKTAKREVIGHSLDSKRRSYRLVMEENIPSLK